MFWTAVYPILLLSYSSQGRVVFAKQIQPDLDCFWISLVYRGSGCTALREREERLDQADGSHRDQ